MAAHCASNIAKFGRDEIHSAEVTSMEVLVGFWIQVYRSSHGNGSQIPPVYTISHHPHSDVDGREPEDVTTVYEVAGIEQRSEDPRQHLLPVLGVLCWGLSEVARDQLPHSEHRLHVYFAED